MGTKAIWQINCSPILKYADLANPKPPYAATQRAFDKAARLSQTAGFVGFTAYPLIYCYTGHSSEHLAELFGSFGFRSLYSLEGGYAGWQAAHGQTASGP